MEMNNKSEGRNPKPETRKKPEDRNPKASPAGARFWIRHSDFFRISTFGFRISHNRIEPFLA